MLLLFCLYNANAITNPPTKASPALAKFATAAFEVALAALEVDEDPDEVLVAEVLGLSVVERVTFELETPVTEAELDENEDVGAERFALVEVETTMAVEEGTKEVEVLVDAEPVAN